MDKQTVEQAVLVPGVVLNPNRVVSKISLFDAEGKPIVFAPGQVTSISYVDDYGTIVYGGIAGAVANGNALRACANALRLAGGGVINTRLKAPLLVDWVDLATIPGATASTGQVKCNLGLGTNVRLGSSVWLMADTYTVAKYGPQGTVRNAGVHSLNNSVGNPGVGWDGFTYDGQGDMQLVSVGLGPTRNGVYTKGDFVQDGAFMLSPKNGSFTNGHIRNVRGVGSFTDATHAETFCIMINGNNAPSTNLHTLVSGNEVSGLNSAGTGAGSSSSGISHQSMTGGLSIGNRCTNLGGNGFPDNNVIGLRHLGEDASANVGTGFNIEKCVRVVYVGGASSSNTAYGGNINATAGGTTSDCGFIGTSFNGNAQSGIIAQSNGGTFLRNFALGCTASNNTNYGITVSSGATSGFFIDTPTLMGLTGNVISAMQVSGMVSQAGTSGTALNVPLGGYIQNSANNGVRGLPMPFSGATTPNLLPFGCVVEVTTGAGVTVSAASVNGISVPFSLPQGSVGLLPLKVVPLGGTVGLTYAGGIPSWKFISAL